MLIIEEGNKVKVIIDSLLLILWFLFGILGTVLTLLLIFSIKWTNIGKLLLGTIIIFIGTILFYWLVYQWLTKIISENFSIELYDEYFIFKSSLIKQTIRYVDIKNIYIVSRRYSKWKKSFELLKIRSKSNKRIYLSFGVLDKKEVKELKRIFKEKTGQKIRQNFEFWE